MTTADDPRRRSGPNSRCALSTAISFLIVLISGCSESDPLPDRVAPKSQKTSETAQGSKPPPARFCDIEALPKFIRSRIKQEDGLRKVNSDCLGERVRVVGEVVGVRRDSGVRLVLLSDADRNLWEFPSDAQYGAEVDQTAYVTYIRENHTVWLADKTDADMIASGCPSDPDEGSLSRNASRICRVASLDFSLSDLRVHSKGYKPIDRHALVDLVDQMYPGLAEERRRDLCARIEHQMRRGNVREAAKLWERAQALDRCN